MKKKRVLALLLALSLAVSMNGMTVLAAGSGAQDMSVTFEADNDSISAGEERADAQETEDQTGEDASGGQAVPGISSGEEEIEGDTNPDNAGASEGTDISDENGSSEGTQTPDDPTHEGEQNPDEGTDQPSEDADSDDIEEPDGEEETDADVEDAEYEADGEDETLLDPAQAVAPKMMSFTDETGLRVTYNANEQYQYTIDESGTLTAIKKENGDEVEGNIVLDADRGITKIASGAFTGNTKITYVKMPDGVTSIGENAFKGCTSLKGMTIPTGVSVIEASAFEGCSALTQFALPATVERIGNRAFYGDAHLFMVYMRNIDISVLKTIGDYAFYGCSELVNFCSDTKFTFPYELTTIGAYAFNGCSSVKDVAFPENVTTMGDHAFEACSSLEKVSLSAKLEAVSQYGFADCRSLLTLKFGVGSQSMTIDSYAFKGCYNLGGVQLGFNVSRINANAFLECSRLVRVEIANGICVLEDNAFPDVETLYLVGHIGSTAETYAKTRKIKFINIGAVIDDSYYTYSAEPLGNGVGTITVSTVKSSEQKEIENGDVKKANDGKGVKAGTIVYVYPTASKGSKFVSGSLKCNGEPFVKKKANEYPDFYIDEEGYYTMVMPKGGAVINAEFEITGGSSAIVGTDVTYEFSNGDELKIGQTTRIFVLDADNKIIPASKVKFVSDKPDIAKVSSTGMITALKEGLAHIDMTLTGGNGEITKRATIQVRKSDVAFIKLTAAPGEYDKDIFTISDRIVGDSTVQVASITKQSVSYDSAKLPLKALAYDTESDSMSVALKWTSSDSKVAKLASATTADADSVNEITIPKRASGEATITVTATNADKKTIKQKFIIQVVDATPRLSASTLTLNPNKEDGAVLRVISAYGQKFIDPANTFKIVDAENDKIEITDFKTTYDKANSTDTVQSYIINTLKGVDEKTYSVKVKIDDCTPIPLKITVKSSMPDPKVSFAKKQKKINLFYANDGTEVTPVITNLGSAKVASYSLEPLSTSQTKNDWMFTENFQVDEETGVITQKNENMTYTDKGKLVDTGYLVLHFDGYKSDKVKKYKVTIPTQTTKPSYKLNKTSDVYNTTSVAKTVTLKLLDSKTNKPVTMEEGEWTVEKSSKSTSPSVSKNNISINSEGQIEMIVDARPTKGKIVLSVRNEAWAEGKAFNYTYTIKTTNADPKIKLKSTTVSLNSNYTDQVGTFSLVSNQCDTVLAENQSFEPKPTTKNRAEYDKIHIDYANGEGTVSVDSGIKAGSYQFQCKPVYGSNDEPYNAVTLTVKVTNTLPGMTVKGSPALNLAAVSDVGYTETAELKLTAKVPEAYEIGEDSIKNIKCTTKGKSGVEENFDWDIQDNVLLISLNSAVAQQKYSFSMTPVYRSFDSGNSFEGKAVKFTVNVYKGTPSLKMSAKGVLNLLDRSGQYTLKNSIVYTPTFKNLKDTVEDVQIFDASGADPELGDEESEYFQAEVLNGKIYVAPKEGAQLANKKTYPIKMWVKLASYPGNDSGGMWVPGILNIKTAQIIPKVTTNKTNLNLYLSNKSYESTFTVTPKKGSIGKAVGVEFGEKDTKSQDSFDVDCIPQEDGSVVVNVKLKDTVSFANNSTSKVDMYVVFEGQGVDTLGPKITMNVKINK